MKRIIAVPVEKQTIIDAIGEEGFNRAVTIGTIEEVRPGYYTLSEWYRKKIINSLTNGIDVSLLINRLEREKERKCQGADFYKRKLEEIQDNDNLILQDVYAGNWEGYVLMMLMNSTTNFLTDNKSYFSSPQFERLRLFTQNLHVIEYLHEKVKKGKRGNIKNENYNDLFNNDDDAKEVDRLLKQPKFFKNDKYVPLSGAKSELVKAFFVLKKKGVIQTKNLADDARLFCMNFGYEENELKPNTLRKEPIQGDSEDIFEDLFYNIGQ